MDKDPEVTRERAREWYRENREYVLAKRRMERRDPEFQRKREEYRERRNALQQERRKRKSEAQLGQVAQQNKSYLKARYHQRHRMVKRLKTDRGCLVCGSRETERLHFHHRDPEAKRAKISGAFLMVKLERLLAEMEKCDVLCADCHRQRHREMRGLA